MRRFKKEQKSCGVLCENSCATELELAGFRKTGRWLLPKAFCGYTLAEIVVVLIIVAVIVAVTIGVTKHKLDNIVTYTYYSAYSSLRTATSQILSDYDPSNDRYKAQVQEKTLLSKVSDFFRSNFGLLAAVSMDVNGVPDYCFYVNSNYRYPIKCPSTTPGFDSSSNIPTNCCRGNEVLTLYKSKSSNGWVQVGSTGSCDWRAFETTPARKCVNTDYVCCKPLTMSDGSSTCLGDKEWNSSTRKCECPGQLVDLGNNVCGCPEGKHEQYILGSGKVCVPDDDTPETKECTGFQPACSPGCDTTTGQWKPAKTCGDGELLNTSTCECYDDPSDDCTGGKIWNGSSCVCPNGKEDVNGTCKDPCTGGKVRDGSGNCVCPDGKEDVNGTCKDSCTGGKVRDGSGNCVCPDGKEDVNGTCKDPCTGGQIRNSSTGACECPSGKVWNGSECVVPDYDCSGTAPCGKECDRTTGTWVDISGFSRECNEDLNKTWSEDSCSCIPTSTIIPPKGQNYCEALVSLLNTRSNSAECSGGAIGTNVTDFSSQTPDITLRNGMRLYNVRQNPQALSILEGNREGGKAVIDGVEVDTNRYGYTVYIDIDGEKGGSEKWVDVYPFYVTLSGMVIPGYDKAHPGLYGGDSRDHMQVSIEDEIIDGGKRKIRWLAKSVSFREGACGAGYIGANTPYCKNGTAVPLKSECSGDNSLCRLKYIKPIKFLF